MESTSLGPLERRVMDHLWHVGPSSVGDVVDALNSAGDRKLAYTTIMTILVRLNEKRYASRTREGRGFRYAAAFPERELAAAIARRELRLLIDRHGADSLAGFAADLVGADAELTARLRAIADESGDA